MKNITFSAEENLIRRARERAAAENTTLNVEFRRWLEKYAERPKSKEDFDDLVKLFGYVQHSEDLHDGQQVRGLQIVNPYR